MTSRRSASVASTALALFAGAPWVVVYVLKVVVHPRPFWAFYYDPEAIYFFEGIDFNRLRFLGSFDRPGAPVQYLSALIVRVWELGALDFDRFRGIAYAWTLVLALGSCGLLAVSVLKGLDPLGRLTTIWFFLTFPQAFEYAMVWSPEALVLPLGGFGLIALLSIEKDFASCRRRFLVGVVLGSLCALKLTFLPWVAGGVVASWATRDLSRGRRLRDIAALVAGTALAFGLWTAHLLARTGDLVAWIWAVVSRSGPYGTGAPGLPSASDIAHNLLGLLASAKGTTLLLAILIVWVLTERARRGISLWANDADSWVLRFSLATLGFYLPLAIRQPVGRYFLPVGLIGILLIRAWFRQARAARMPMFAGILTVVVAGLAVKQAVLDQRIHRSRINRETQLRGALLSHTERLKAGGSTNGAVIWSFRAPLPSYALHSMAHSDEDHSQIFAAYPEEGFLDWTGQIRFPPAAADWSVLALQKDELEGARQFCSGGIEVERFVLFRRADCPSLPLRLAPRVG